MIVRCRVRPCVSPGKICFRADETQWLTAGLGSFQTVRFGVRFGRSRHRRRTRSRPLADLGQVRFSAA